MEIRGDLRMRECKITVMKKANYTDLSEKYENRLTLPCSLQEGQVFVVDQLIQPEGMCESAWQTLYPFVMTLMCGGQNIYDGWMKNSQSAMVSCNDGFRPVSFYIEVIENKEQSGCEQ